MDSLGIMQRLGFPAACGRGGCNDSADIATTEGRTLVFVPLWFLVRLRPPVSRHLAAERP